jgi:hypothetical protein
MSETPLCVARVVRGGVRKHESRQIMLDDTDLKSLRVLAYHLEAGVLAYRGVTNATLAEELHLPWHKEIFSCRFG